MSNNKLSWKLPAILFALCKSKYVGAYQNGAAIMVRPLWCGRYGAAVIVRPLWCGRYGTAVMVRPLWCGDSMVLVFYGARQYGAMVLFGIFGGPYKGRFVNWVFLMLQITISIHNQCWKLFLSHNQWQATCTMWSEKIAEKIYAVWKFDY